MAAPAPLIDPTDPLRRFSECAELGYPSAFTLRRRRKDGSLPAVWCGNHWKCRLSDVERLYPRQDSADDADLDELRAWARRQAATAPPIPSPAAARMVVEILRRGTSRAS
ncbi:MAG: hypothetical protein QM809_10325 [Gordonia sp. (in: high G+C Gram-positive bacteria)]|uniref:hypothetical protein n=1 Tax=Gordonia sp. (in: high G+C Gram-positive bacteria) TaxID=84139 RepID=UPI0039E6C8F8